MRIKLGHDPGRVEGGASSSCWVDSYGTTLRPVCALIAVRHGEIAVACPFPSRAVESPALFLFFYSSFCRPAHWILLQLLQNCSAKKTADIIIIYYLLLEYLKIICRYVPYSVLRTVCVMWMLLPETKLPFLGTHLVAPYQLFLGARAT